MGAGLLYLLAYVLSLVCGVAPCLLSFGAAVLPFFGRREWERRFSLTIPRSGWYAVRTLHVPCQRPFAFFSEPGDRLACDSHSANAVPTTFPYIHATVCDGCGVAVSAVVLKLGPYGPNFMARNLTLGPFYGGL